MENALVSTGKGRPEVEGRGSEEGGLEGREPELAAEGGLVHERGVEGLGGSGSAAAEPDGIRCIPCRERHGFPD